MKQNSSLKDIAFAMLPCISWGLACQFWVRLRYDFCNNCFLLKSVCYRLWYMFFASLVLMSLLYSYKKYIRDIYYNYGRVYKIYYLLFLLSSFVCFLTGFPGSKSDEFLEGLFVSPFNEELLAHFSLYKFRSYSLRKYLFLAFFLP